MSEAKSPLAEALPDSIREVMSRDPLDLTRENRDQIVKELRRARELFEQEDNKPKAEKKGKKLKAVVGKVNLEDFGL